VKKKRVVPVSDACCVVPAGISESEYKKKIAEEKQKKAANKQRFPKGNAFVDMGKWLNQMESRQTFKGSTYSSSGHTYAKQKFSSKDEYDAAKGKK